jgi:short-subunit dehydrogenase involved in D-alanine esterification of teichoic acids
MKELKNVVTVTGELVKNNIEEFQTKKGEDAIGGSLVLRTSDGSEHEINLFAYKFKKDENKNFTSEESYFYKQYSDAKENLKDIEHCSEGDKPAIVSITDGSFRVNDFKGNDGRVVSTNRISARFINKVEPKDYDSTVLESKFEVEGVVESIKDEIIKDVPTGNLIVNMMGIGQTADGFGKDAVYTADHLIPIKMTVDKSMAAPFRSAGYYDGCYTKFVGTVINSVETEEQIEKVAFGDDIKHLVKTYVRKNEIKSGTMSSTIFEHELTQEIVDALRAKRKATIAEVASGQSKQEELPFKPNTSTPAPQTTYNPFAQH